MLFGLPWSCSPSRALMLTGRYAMRAAVLVRDSSGSVVSIPTGEVPKIDTSPVSLMPPGPTSTL